MKTSSWLTIKFFLALTSMTGVLNFLFLITYSGSMNSELSSSDYSTIRRRQISSIETNSDEENADVSGPKYGHLELLNFDVKDILDRYTGAMDTLGKEYELAKSDGQPKQDGGVEKISTSGGEAILAPRCEVQPFLLVLIHSSPESFMSRQSIRLSWGRQENAINQGSWIKPDRTWKTVFLVGRSNSSRTNALVQQESHMYGDVLVGDFTDNYRHLSLKMLLGLKWARRHCQAKYLLKTDEDCYVNIVSLMLWLSGYHNHYSSKPLYTGKVQRNMDVVRTLGHRYYVSRTEHPNEYYKPYVSGGGYLFSGHLLDKLYKVSRKIPIFPVEDALFGRLMDILGVPPTNDRRFLPFVACENPHDETLFRRPMCHFKKPLVIHGISDTQQIYMHYNVLIMTFVPTVCSYVEHQSDQNKMSRIC